MRLDLLRKVYEHNKNNRRHEEFDLTVFNDSSIFPSNVCNTAGCLVGELPIMGETMEEFKNWKFAKWGMDNAIVNSVLYTNILNPWNQLVRFFELPMGVIHHLFLPENQLKGWGELEDEVDLETTLVNFEQTLIALEELQATNPEPNDEEIINYLINYKL